MQKLQLYIGSDRVELFKDEAVSLTQTIQNVRDIKKMLKGGVSFDDIAAGYDVGASAIRAIKEKRSWKHIGKPLPPYIPSEAPGESSEPCPGVGMNIDIWL